METIQISTGKITLEVNRDGEKVGAISFDPTDLLFADKFYRLIDTFRRMQLEYSRRADEIEQNKELDGNGIELRIPQSIELLIEVCTNVRKEIDVLFGEGTSQTCFGNMMRLEMIDQFFSITSKYFKNTRNEKASKHIARPRKDEALQETIAKSGKHRKRN